MTTRYEIHGNIALITLDNPPINSLNLHTRQALFENIERAEADPSIDAVVVTGGVRLFSGGGDIREFTTPQLRCEPILSRVIRALEECGKPTIAAIGGVCLGGGLELALACHYRVADVNAKFALPEVTLGLLPGAGGSQRLPRVVGVQQALKMIVSGEIVNTEALAKLSGQTLLTMVLEDDLLAGALTFARNVAHKRPLPRVRDLACPYPESEMSFRQIYREIESTSRGFPAPCKGVDAVEAAVNLGFDEGLKFERELFSQLMQTPQSRALRHAFLAKRASSKISGISGICAPRTVNKVAIIGAGTMGAGIAMSFLNAGFPVHLLESDPNALERGVGIIRKTYEAQIAKGRLDRQQYDRRLAALHPTLRYEDIGDVDLMIEAVFEDLGVKEQVFRKLDAVAKQGAILASNTSTLNLNKIAFFTGRPQDVVGTHFFSPANIMNLLEVVRGDRTGGDVLSTVMEIAKKLRKVAVMSGVCDGFIGNRMIQQYTRQAGFLLDEGCLPCEVDRAIEAFGFAMGPFRMGDLAGNDVSWAIRKRRYVEMPALRYSKAPDLLCEMGRYGQKKNAGWYDYLPGKRDPIPNEDVHKMLQEHRKSLGIEARNISNDEIVHRLLYALVNEAAYILQEGIASKASDIDVVYLTGYGFPAQHGGPLFYADTVGLRNVVHVMGGYSRNPYSDPQFWQPAPLLAKLAAEGGMFNP